MPTFWSLSTPLLGALALALYVWQRRRPGGPIDARGVLARLPLPMLALAASYGVYSFATLFVPPLVAATQAAAFELTYIGLAVTRGLGPEQRRRATAISVGAVVASIVYNTLAGWFHRQPELLDGARPEAWLMFAILHGAPLAWVAYLVADLLLHSEPARPKAAHRPRLARAIWRLRGQARAQAEQLRNYRATIERESRAAALNFERAEQFEVDLAQAQQQAAQERREFDQVAAQLRAEAAEARAAAMLDIRAIARGMVAAGVPQREAARLLGVAEATLRGWLKAATNGHAVEG
jgi:hypothetical protein